MGQFGVGQSVLRKEDNRHLTGRAQFQDDVNLDGQAHAAIFRSPHAHAKIGAVETAKAEASPGVLAVYTGADVAAAGLTPLPCLVLPRTGRAQAARRHGRLLPAAPDHLRDAGQACRRPGGDGGRRDAC